MKLLLSFLFTVSILGLKAQELNCTVTIVTDANLEVSTNDKDIIDQLKQTVYEFMNNTQWTKDKFKIEERINCNIQIQIQSIPSTGNFVGSMQVQSTRPALNSSYNTTVFNFQDDNVQFGFQRNAILNYAPNQFRDNLTSILAFYAYFIIGMDYDTFSLKGGTPYFNEAQNIVANAQSAAGTGWKSNESGGKRNRYWLVDNILQQLFEPLRECTYEYHRKGVDKMYSNLDEARKNIYAAMTKLNRVASTRPNSVNLLNFVQAKSLELKNLYEDAEIKEKQDLVNLMSRIDPANASKYEQILN
ncbi:MAG: DUF4835 family protein [Crocinitomicaceae bacterium]|jgi:hypothetical protein|nr:DUF4835 family protein [Crocinitomicaceae bacterium]